MSVVRTPARWLFVVLFVASLAALFLPVSGGSSVVPDKLVHLIIFAALASVGRIAGFRIAPLVGGLVLYAVTSEIVQGALPAGRTADWRDSAADTCGIVVGLIAAQLLVALIDRTGPYRADLLADDDMPEHQR